MECLNTYRDTPSRNKNNQFMSEIWVRIATGAGLIALMIIGTAFNQMTFFIVYGLIQVLCLLEFYKIVFSQNPKDIFNIIRKICGIVLAIIPFWAMAAYVSGIAIFEPLYLILFSLAFFLLMVFELFAKAPHPINNIVFTGFSVFYIGFSFMMLAYFQHLYGKPLIVLGLIMLIFMNDSMSYVFGRWKGKTPLFPRISPKKTWEGAIGGSFCTLGMAISYEYFFFPNMPFLWDWLTIALIIIIMGPIGDLTESMLKRNFNFKDSGSLLPGHGGFLDRFDAFIFIIPFVTLYYFMVYGM